MKKLILLLFFSFLFSCSNSMEDKIIGQWVMNFEDEAFKQNADGVTDSINAIVSSFSKDGTGEYTIMTFFSPSKYQKNNNLPINKSSFIWHLKEDTLIIESTEIVINKGNSIIDTFLVHFNSIDSYTQKSVYADAIPVEYIRLKKTTNENINP